MKGDEQNGTKNKGETQNTPVDSKRLRASEGSAFSATTQAQKNWPIVNWKSMSEG